MVLRLDISTHYKALVGHVDSVKETLASIYINWIDGKEGLDRWVLEYTFPPSEFNVDWS
jgi:hypothetical protein